MKKIILFCLALLAMGVNTQEAKAQKMSAGVDSTTVDTVKYRITYDHKFVRDTTSTPYRQLPDEVRLDVGRSGITHFYSYGQEKLTQIMLDMLNKSGTIELGKTPKTGAMNFAFLGNYPSEGMTSYIQRMGRTYYNVEEDAETPEWEMVSDSVKTILGYSCEMAKAQFHGRTWLVYFTEEVPLSLGPWKLGGLPGLVLEARDSKNQYVWTAVGIEEPKGDVAMKMVKKQRENVSWKQLKKVIDSFDIAADMSQGNAKAWDKDGNPISPKQVPRKPSNPIELE